MNNQNSRPQLTRRSFLKFLAVGTVGLGAALYGILKNNLSVRSEQSGDMKTFIPMLFNGKVPSAPGGSAKVIHTFCPSATYWTGSDPQFWKYVDQDVVNGMVDRGLMALTNTSTIVSAWQALLPAYRQGEGIAIKVNFNTTKACSETDGEIDGLIQPVNGLIRGMLARGVAANDIWVYDAIRVLPDRFVNACQYPGVRFFDRECRERATFTSSDPSAFVRFSSPAGIPVPPATRVADLVVQAKYLINMPILKKHSIPGFTLGFKNHFGTIDKPLQLHEYIGLGRDYYRSDYNLLVDIYRNPNIQKTILTVGDGLFGYRGSGDGSPTVWSTFGNKFPNSLFFAIDPVAFDCVLGDFLNAEISLDLRAYDYLKYAAASGLGIFEQGDPWGAGYTKIQYQKIELTSSQCTENFLS